VKSLALQVSDDENIARLEQAIRHCARGWLPVQASVYNRFKERLRAGEYEGKHEHFLLDLRADPALFFYVASRFCHLFPSLHQGAGATYPSMSEMAEVLQSLPPRAEDLSLHTLSNASKLQVARLRHGVVSTSTAELIAVKHGYDSLSTFSCASLRQLGLSLIAFNYPSIYRRACEESRARSVSVALEVERLLGFSPEKLAACLGMKWGMREDIAHSVLATPIGRPPTTSQNLPWVLRFATVGESFARLSDHDTYPHAFEEGQWVKDEFTKLLGKDALALVQEKITETFLAQGLSLDSAKNTLGSLEEIIERSHSSFASHSMKENQALQECSQATVELFQQIYALIRPRSASLAATNHLVSEVVPRLGFSRGCIYVVDQKTQIALPRLRFSPDDATRYCAVSLTQGTELAHLLASARNAPAPLREKNVFLHSATPMSHVTWKLGDEKNLGILHLEVNEEHTDRSSRDILTLFEVLRRALLCCVGLP
jgi:HDOD domain